MHQVLPPFCNGSVLSSRRCFIVRLAFECSGTTTNLSRLSIEARGSVGWGREDGGLSSVGFDGHVFCE
jgi:hypothetical protein